MRFNLLTHITKLILLLVLIRKSVYSYFITVDETKFHLVKSYLCRYGYMNENVCKQHADDSLKFMQNNARDIYRGLVIFQTMFNITRTGKIDEDTIMKMAKPRCGNKDFDLQFSSSKFLSFRTNDFSLLRKGLKRLTYSIKKYNPYLNRFSKTLSNEAVEALVEKAFNAWLKHLHGDVRVAKLNDIDEIYENSNITIYFAEGNHGDSMLFDGIDGELAHSCSLSNTQSPYRGHVHLDDSENWSKGDRLMSVLMHEIGHLFGLDHSSNPKSIMSPLFYFGSDEILEEDIKNLRMILGLESRHRQYYEKTTKTTTIKKTTTSPETLPPTTESTTTYRTPVITTTTQPITTTTQPITTTTQPIATTTQPIATTTQPITTTTQPIITTKTASTTNFESTTLELTTTTVESTTTTTISTTTVAVATTELSTTTENIEFEIEEDEEEEATVEVTTTESTTTLFQDLKAEKNNESTEEEEEIETENENDTTAEIIFNRNSEELKSFSEMLKATTQATILEVNEQDTSSFHEKNEISSTTVSNRLNETLEENEEEYSDELILVTTTSTITTTTQNFLTSLIDSAMLQLNKTNSFNSQLDLVNNSTQQVTSTVVLNTTEADNEYEDSEEVEDKTNESEFQELLKMIGTTTTTLSPVVTKQNDAPITSKLFFTTEQNFQADLDDDKEEEEESNNINFNSTTVQMIMTTNQMKDEYFTSLENELSHDNNKTLNLTTTPFVYKSTTKLILDDDNKKNENLTNVEEYTTEEPIEVESTEESTIESTTMTTTTEATTEEITTEQTTTTKITTTQEVMATEQVTSTQITTTQEVTTTTEEAATFSTVVTSTSKISTEKINLPSTTNLPKTTKLISSMQLIASTNKVEPEEEPADLCNDPVVDAITRTEWGNALIFKGNYIWHIRGLTKWRLFDYEGWPKKISTLFPGLPGHIDSAYLYDDLYHFTKNQTIWKYKVVLSYPPKYVLVKGYPKLLKEEYQDIPFKSVDSAFSIASSIFFFKDYEFWQSDWNTNVTGKIPFKTNAAVSWRNPRLDNSLTEPLAYIVSNSSLYKFNYWSIPISQEALDIRYFLFDCVQANYKPHNPLFLGPSYKQAFIADDVYNRESRLSARNAPSYLARLTRNSIDKNETQSKQDIPNVLIKNFYSSSSNVKFSLSLISSLIFIVLSLF